MRRLFSGILAALLTVTATAAMAQDKPPLKLGGILDMSGLYADITGPGAETAAKMAAEDFGGEVLGRKIEIVAADHLNKADLSANIADLVAGCQEAGSEEALSSRRSADSPAIAKSEAHQWEFYLDGLRRRRKRPKAASTRSAEGLPDPPDALQPPDEPPLPPAGPASGIVAVAESTRSTHAK